MASVLIVDDDKSIRSTLGTYIRSLGHEAEAAGDAADALGALAREKFDIVLSDVRMGGLDGIELLREIRADWPETVVILMTAYATVAQAVEAIHAGAYDYLVKPFSPEQVALRLSRAVELLSLRNENRALRGALDRPLLLQSVSPRTRSAIDKARDAAASEATLLLTGESGTGKSALAAAVHGWSPRRDGPFVAISCASLNDRILESALFGHVKGAFPSAWKNTLGRLEAAAGGTIFLDDVAELPSTLQGQLLRFVENRRFERVGGTHTIEVDARIIAATSRNLEVEVAAGRLREDLFHRLNVLRIDLPPLRDRLEDLPALARSILQGLTARYSRPLLELDSEAAAALARYRWPGNVRELLNVLEHAAVVSGGNVVRVDQLPDRLQAPTPAPTLAGASEKSLSLEEMEQQQIRFALADSSTLEEAAARLGISATTLWRKRKRYSLE